MRSQRAGLHPAPLRVSLGSSRGLGGALGAGGVVAVAGVSLMELPLSVRAFLALGLVWIWVREHRAHVSRTACDSIVSVRFHSRGVELSLRDGSRLAASAVRFTRVTPMLVCGIVTGAGRARAVVVPADAVAGDVHRRLRCMAREHDAGPPGGGP